MPEDPLEELLVSIDRSVVEALDRRLDRNAFITRARGFGATAPMPPGRLSAMEKALLERLASGSTIAAAAAAEFMSLRTANRRIAELRRRSGTRTTRELLSVYRWALRGADRGLSDP